MNKRIIAAILLICLSLSGCSLNRETPLSSTSLTESSQSSTSGEPQKESSGAEEGPTKEEVKKLFSAAMFLINDLATEDPTFVIGQIFGGDIEFDYDDQITIDHFPYVRTFRPGKPWIGLCPQSLQM